MIPSPKGKISVRSRRDVLSDSIPIIKVNHKGGTRLRAGHPWVYRSDLAVPEGTPMGALVHVHDGRGRWLGSALYSSSSQIAIRMLSTEDLGEADLLPLVRQRLAHAIDFRSQVVRHADAFRVVFSEADLLPGLIVDKYNDVLSLQVLTQAFDRPDLRQTVLGALGEQFPGASVLERVDPHIRELEQLPVRESQLLAGERTQTVFELNGVKFRFDGMGGQKTGAFPGSARELCRRGPIRPRRGTRLLYLPGRLCAASGARLRQRHSGGCLAPGAGDSRAE